MFFFFFFKAEIVVFVVKILCIFSPAVTRSGCSAMLHVCYHKSFSRPATCPARVERKGSDL